MQTVLPSLEETLRQPFYRQYMFHPSNSERPCRKAQALGFTTASRVPRPRLKMWCCSPTVARHHASITSNLHAGLIRSRRDDDSFVFSYDARISGRIFWARGLCFGEGSHRVLVCCGEPAKTGTAQAPIPIPAPSPDSGFPGDHPARDRVLPPGQRSANARRSATSLHDEFLKKSSSANGSSTPGHSAWAIVVTAGRARAGESRSV